MKLTHEQIEAGRSDAGGFNLAQLKALGFPLPPKGWPRSGWPKLLMAMEVTPAQYAEFLNLRGSKREQAARATPELFHVKPAFDAKSAEEFANQMYKEHPEWFN